MNFDDLNEKELLQLQASITNELIKREIVRTQNNPLGDYTEWLVSEALDLELEVNSKSGFDAVDKTGTRIQIKGRRITLKNKSRQLSAIRKYEEKDFDDLIAVIFDENFNVIEACLIPHEVVGEYATYRKHVNGHVLNLKGPILSDVRIKDLKLTVTN